VPNIDVCQYLVNISDMWNRYGIGILGVITGVVYWPIEAMVHTMIFHSGSFQQNLLELSTNEIWMRSLISIMFMAFGLFAQHFINRQRQLLFTLNTQGKRIQRIVDTAYEAFIAIDSNGCVTEWNRRSEALFGWLKDEVIGKSLAELIIPQHLRSAHTRGLQRYLDTGSGPMLYKRVEVTAVSRAGREIKIAMAIVPLDAGGNQEFFAFIRAPGESFDDSGSGQQGPE